MGFSATPLVGPERAIDSVPRSDPFYAWKRRFREAPPASPRVPERPAARPIPEANGASTPAFLPVSIRDAAAAGQPEIELANACVVRLKGAVDPRLLRIAIQAVGRPGGDGRGGD